jgi:hypothetical protein
MQLPFRKVLTGDLEPRQVRFRCTNYTNPSQGRPDIRFLSPLQSQIDAALKVIGSVHDRHSQCRHQRAKYGLKVASEKSGRTPDKMAVQMSCQGSSIRSGKLLVEGQGVTVAAVIDPLAIPRSPERIFVIDRPVLALSSPTQFTRYPAYLYPSLLPCVLIFE